MTTPETPKQEQQITPPAESKPDVIPAQYKDMPSEVVEELWQSKVYVDPEKNKAESERRQQALEAIKQGETDRETTKQQQLTERYTKLPAEQKTEFPTAQTDAGKILNEHIQGARELDGLSPEEYFVLGKLKTAYEDFKRENPDKPFAFDFSKDIDRSVYNNLAQRLALKVLEGKQRIGDQEKANVIRQELGVPVQKIRTEGLLVPETTPPVEKPDMYKGIADKIPFDENNPPNPESILPIVAGNMFGDNDKQTLAGKIIGREIYDKLVERLDSKSASSAQELIQLGREGLEDFKKYITQLDEQSKKGGGKGYEFNVDRPAGTTGFHLNGEPGHVSRDHLFYFSKTTQEWKNPNEQQVRAYLTISPDEMQNVQRHFADLCKMLYEAGVDFTGKAASPNGLGKRTDNIVLYISASDQARAGKMIKDYLQDRKIGKGHVAAAIPSPDQEGLSWALEPNAEDVKLWRDVSGSSEQASYNAVIATKVVPSYLRRLAEAHQKLGNQKEAQTFNDEANRVETLIKKPK